MAKVINVILGWDMDFSIWVSAPTVAAYVLLGGLLSAIFNEVLHLVLIWLGALLIAIVGSSRPAAGPAWSPASTPLPRSGLHPSLEHARPLPRQSDGHPLDRHCVRPRRDYFFRILDHRFPRRAARPLRQGSALRQARPHHRRGLKMLVPLIVILPGLLGLAVLPIKSGGRR